jgi:hypothetical protein
MSYDCIKGHYKGALEAMQWFKSGYPNVIFEENEEGDKGDDDEQEEMMEEPIISHSKIIRFLCSSQATPRKASKAKEKALVVSKSKGKEKLKEMGKAKDNQKVKESSQGKG